ncbi:vomeronasal type-2 receptor 26-like [Dendropsophus ebraccatus]|uniref:vomeronasal type-2 receptor 26-like n=1 Tax=Dendropsophus ebraccatus TaxID=150705 RepID=UPI0038323265
MEPGMIEAVAPGPAQIPTADCVTPREYTHLLAFLYTIEIINKDTDILPNITLGYHIYDSCGYQNKVIKDVLQIMSGHTVTAPNYSCMEKDAVVGFIGDLRSATTIPMAQLLSFYGYTHKQFTLRNRHRNSKRNPLRGLYSKFRLPLYLNISYGTTDPLLRDKSLYPNFFRTVPDDTLYYKALVMLLGRFQWSWVGIITSDDDSGQRELQELRKSFTSHKICVEFKVVVSTKIINIVPLTLQSSSTDVIIICGSYSVAFIAFLHNAASVLNNKTLIFLKSWSFPDELLPFGGNDSPANCSLSPSICTYNSPGMEEYFLNVQLSNRPFDELLEEIWMITFNCFSKNNLKNEILSHLYNIPFHYCSGERRFTDHFHFSGDATPFQVYMAVLIMAEALHSMNSILSKNGNHNNAKLHAYKYKTVTHFYNFSVDLLYFVTIFYSENCQRCPDHEWPNEGKTKCFIRHYEFLSYETDVVALVFSIISILLSLITLCIIGIFTLFRNITIVRANNRNLSFILLISLMFSLLCVFLFIGRPVDITCMLRQIFYGVFFTVAVSSVLAKTIIVCIAFKATRPDSPWRKCVGVKLPYTVVLVCSSIQILNAVIWLSLSPPYQEYNLDYPGKIIIQCNEGSLLAFYLMLGYMGFLAAVSFVLAFLVRTLPDIYNEAKYITFSMLVFCSVWICAIPAYLSSTGKHMVTVEIFAILASGGGILGCMFLPKCYIILMEPENLVKEKENKIFFHVKN